MSKRGRGGNNKRCPGCGRYSGSSCGNCSSHHWRPRSRGGGDSQENLVTMPDKDIHRQIHALFGNDRLSEVVGKLVMHWDTVCPHVEVDEKNTHKRRLNSRKKAWDKFFGPRRGRNKGQTLKYFLREFVVNASVEDKRLVIEVLRKGAACKELTQKEFESLSRLLEK
ncbi:MAG: hypothetical protein R3346_03475 [Candidatus Spechtbacterales bacterium]|nr:hypothetical protein [Candidatus Spechtbacterales bacterium]